MSEYTPWRPDHAGPDALPAADITRDRPLVREGKQRRTVTRQPDGCLEVGVRGVVGGSSHTLLAPLARWLEQDGTALTWRLLPTRDGSTAWNLCLVDLGTDEVRWREGMRDLPAVLPPAAPHAYGGPMLGPGARLRHQSLTSPSGIHTLVHQDDGNLVLYCAPARRALWATDTWWAGDGWAELTDDGDLIVRNLCGTPVWQSHTGGKGVLELAVDDDGMVALRDAGGGPVWAVPPHGGCPGGTRTVARGSVLRRGETLERQSLTSDDGGTVFAHRDDRRLVLFAEDGRWLWDGYAWNAERTVLSLDEDAVLRLRTGDGSIEHEFGGPAERLAVRPGEIVLLDAAGTVLWRNGEEVSGGPDTEDWTSWMDVLMDDPAYCVTVIHDVGPREALHRFGAEPEQVGTGTWIDLRSRAAALEADVLDRVVAAYALGPHTLLIEDNGWTGANAPELSEGTFAVSCYRSVNADSTFVVFRDGIEVANHSWDSGSAEPSTPEVRAALAEIGSDDVIQTAFERDLELFCRAAGVRPTVEDVTGPALIAVLPRIGF